MDAYKEFQAKTLDSAIEAACSYFNSAREKLEIEIVNDAKTGIFGLVGAKKAKVRARRMQVAFDNENLSGGGVKADTPAQDRKRPSSTKEDRGPRDDQRKKRDERPVKDKGRDSAPSQNRERASKPADVSAGQSERAVEPNTDQRAERAEGERRQDRKPDERGRNEKRPDRSRNSRPPRKPREDEAASTEAGEEPVVSDQEASSADGEQKNANRRSRGGRRRSRGGRGRGRREDGVNEDGTSQEAGSAVGNVADGADDTLRAGFDVGFEDDAMDDISQEPMPEANLADLDQDKLIVIVTEVVNKLITPVIGETPVEVIIEENRVKATVSSGDNSGLLIGREGQTLAAFQYLINRIVAKNMGVAVRVQLDTGDYRERQDDKLREIALHLADKAKNLGKPQSTRPLSSYHRRIVHLVLQEDDDIQTRSKGDGPLKRVIIGRKRKSA